MKNFRRLVLIACLLPFLLGAVEPSLYMPLDGSAAVLGADGEEFPAGVVHGRGDYLPGVSGQGLLVTRHAYDQVTACEFSKLPALDLNAGALSFWFKPNWQETDEARRRIISFDSGQAFRLYMVKSGSRHIDTSVCVPKQIQILSKNIFRKDEWAHVALSWDTGKGQVLLYINGREVGNKVSPDRFQAMAEKRQPRLWLGDSNADRFDAVVGDGVYDEIKIFTSVLSPEEVAVLAAGGAAAQLEERPLTALRQTSTGLEFVWRHREPDFPAPTTMLRMDNDRQELTMVCLGASNRLALFVKEGDRTQAIEATYQLNWDQPHQLRLEFVDGRLALLLDGALQGDVGLLQPFAPITALKVTPELSLLPADAWPDGATSGNLALGAVSELETSLWSVDDAAWREHGVRRGVCLNGYWRVQPVERYSYAPPTAQWGYMRVPGSFRSPLYDIWRDDNGHLVGMDWQWQGKELIKYRAAWYQRALNIPADFLVGGRVYLHFTNLNGDSGRVYVNGRLIHAFRQDFKNFTTVPNAVRLDLTDLLRPGATNDLTLFIDRDYVGLWQGVPSIGDHGEIALDDVWLEQAPSPLSIKTALALPSCRRQEVTLRARIQNLAGQRGPAVLQFDFLRDGAATSFKKDVVLDGSAEQLLSFTATWANPVLWNVEYPRVYDMTATLTTADGAVADSLGPQTFGFRECWVEDGEIRINGQKARLRMWTSPGLNRLRYYYGHPEAIDQYVAHIREMNYDSVRFDPIRKTSQVAWTDYLEACNRQGLYNLFPMPPYEDEDLTTYRREVERYLERYGNHPTIIMWYTDFNTCSYPWNQDPAKLNDTDYDPLNKRQPRQRARTAEKVMRALDGSRELFQHAGGNSGKIFTSMNYQSFGTPLQEQEDWPRQWAEKHSQPLMVVESAFPYPMQFWHFDNPKLGSLAAEHAARYFGDAVYERETLPIPNAHNWQVTPYANWAPNMQALYAMLYSRVPKAWRAYDMSALGDFPGGRDMHHVARTYDAHTVVYKLDDAVKTPGLKPERKNHWSETQRHLLTDYTQPDYLHDVVRDAFAPLLVFLGGEPEDFSNKDHAYYAGESFRKSVVVVNDHVEPKTLSFRWELRVDGETPPAASGDFTATVPGGGIAKLPIALTAPAVYKRTTAELRLVALQDGALHKEDHMALQFFPARRQPDFRAAIAGVYDPAGKTTAMLNKAGFPFRSVSTLDELRACRLLIIGQNALSQTSPELLRQVENAGLIDNGLKILIFEQQPCKLGNLVFESPSYRNAFVRRPNSPYLAGLAEPDFSNWRGWSDTVPAFVLSAESTPHYPRSKWKCGNGGIVSGHVIRKPSYGNFSTIIDSGFNLMFASLMELRRGHGLILFCQLDVTSRFGVDPVATRLVDNMLSEMAKPFVPVGPQRVQYIGNEESEKILQRMGMIYRRGNPDALWELNHDQVIIIGKDPVPAEKTEELRKALANSNRAIIALPDAPLELLPGAMQRGTHQLFKARVPKDDPLFAGIPDADLYFREARELPVLTTAPDWVVATEPKLFAKLDRPASAIVVLNLAPEGIDGLWNQEKVARVWSAIFNNMNIGLGKDLQLFTASRMRHNTIAIDGADSSDAWSPYIDTLDFYDGDAFHNW